MPAIKFLIGVDEVGRGPIAGPLTLCAFKTTSKQSLSVFRGSRDSKKLTSGMREWWFKKILEKKEEGKVGFALSSIASHVVDTIGLSEATARAVGDSLKKLDVNPRECMVYLDGGLQAPKEFIHQKTIIKGDEKIKVIGLASIIAKVNRDRIMVELSKKYPFYGFQKHKGYGTREHYAQLKKHGLCAIHRRSFLKNRV